MLRDCALNVAPACCSHLRLVTLAGPGPGVHLAPDHTEPLSTGHWSQATDHSHVSHEPRPAPRLSSETRVPSVAEQEEIRTLTMATQKHDKEGSGEQRVDKTSVAQHMFLLSSLLRSLLVSLPILHGGCDNLLYRSSFFFMFLEFPHWVVVTWKLFVRNLVLGKLFEAEHLSSDLELKVTMQEWQMALSFLRKLASTCNWESILVNNNLFDWLPS